jgi:hypothetical protein
MTSERSSTPGEWPRMVSVAEPISADMSVMAQRSVRAKMAVIARSVATKQSSSREARTGLLRRKGSSQ